jgi:hypothetical protein
MIVTFAITWKTNRLKEIRSELLVLTFALGTAGQGVKAVLNLDFATQLFTAVGTILIVLALVNPWYHESAIGKTKHESERELVESTVPYGSTSS